jgi:hypothetical protein
LSFSGSLGVDFRRPEGSLKLKAAWDALHLLNEGVFSQTVIVPLMHDHRILAQVAGYHTELIRFLPPLNIGEEALDYFLAAMEKVLRRAAARSKQRLGDSPDAGEGRCAATCPLTREAQTAPRYFPLQLVTRLFTSTLPRPVAKFQPAPAP